LTEQARLARPLQAVVCRARKHATRLPRGLRPILGYDGRRMADAAPVLEICDLRCTLDGRMVLRGVSLTVGASETVVLLGRSGSGKTTLLKAINGLVATSGGEIRFQGRAASEWDPIRMRRRMGYVIQEAGLFPHWTVEQNIGLVPRLEEWPEERVAKRVEELLEAVSLDPEKFRGRYPRQLSGGERQRVGIARALAADPPLLLLDEPFAALDPITRLGLQRQFLELRRQNGHAAVFVTHDVREAMMLATRIALLRDGTLEALLPPEEFRRAEGAEARAFLEGLDGV
jgi:osmoprotectant transport system ATP-binding protein